jgi:CBS domain-containing protein
MKVHDLLKKKAGKIISVSSDHTIREAMQLILTHKVGALPVIEGNELKGIISERDIFRIAFDKGEAGFKVRVADVMTRDIVIGFPGDDVENVGALMTKNRFRHLPIMDNKKLVGIISIGDVVAANVEKLAVENRYLKDYITGKYPG